jgi:hypothetical protein
MVARVGLSTISALLQHDFSAQSQDRGVNRPPAGNAAAGAEGSQTGRARTTGGTAVAVAAVPLPERSSHEAQQQLELGAVVDGNGARAPSPGRLVRWLP